MSHPDPSQDYISSIFSKYGDVDNVVRDRQDLHNILDRQGSSLLIDALAEHCGNCYLKFRMNDADRMRLLDNMLAELREAILERT